MLRSFYYIEKNNSKKLCLLKFIIFVGVVIVVTHPRHQKI
jgi:hypothetical protein